jgi:hypothetical protein
MTITAKLANHKDGVAGLCLVHNKTVWSLSFDRTMWIWV